MDLRNRLRETSLMFRIGAGCLLLANLSRWFLHLSAGFSQGLVDGATGTLFGLAIGFMLLAVRQKVRQNNGGGGSPCSS